MDQIDRSLLRALQRDGSLSQRDLADQVGMSQNACGRRLKALQEAGVIKGYTIRLDAKAVALGLTVFVMIRTRHHSKVWLDSFRKEVSAIQNGVDLSTICEILMRGFGEFRLAKRLVWTRSNVGCWKSPGKSAIRSAASTRCFGPRPRP